MISPPPTPFMWRLQKSDFNDVKCLNSGFKKLFVRVCLSQPAVKTREDARRDMIRQSPLRQSWSHLITACRTGLNFSNLEERSDVGLFR